MPFCGSQGVGLPLCGCGCPFPRKSLATSFSLSPLQAASTPSGHPGTRLYHSLLALRAKSWALQGIGFASLPLASPPADTVAFLRPGSCSGVLVLLNLGSRPSLLRLQHLGFPTHVKVLFSTHPEPQPEANLEQVQLAPHQAVLLRVPRGHGR